VKDKLDQKTNDLNQLSSDKSIMFNDLEQFKYESHKNIVNLRTKFNNLMDQNNNNLNNIMNK